jgi:DNA-binding beta-propeller fold protein YncE
MGSSKVVVGDLATDEVLAMWDLPEPWPHGITVREDLGRVLVTSTANPAVPGEYGDSVTELDLTTGEVIAVHSTRNAGAEAPSGPVEIFFVPHVEPPVAYVTNIPQGDLWIAEWDPESESFSFRQGFDFTPLGQGVALEVYFDEEAARAYVTTASPGHVNAFDISDPRAPRHLGAVATASGAHHMAFSADGSLGFVQNGLMNLDGLNDGSITVVDLEALEAVGSIDTFRDAGLTVNMIEGMPDDPRAHTH